jgi:hypothetical protein
MSSFMLVLTQGTYVIDDAAAQVVGSAMDSGASSAEIAVDMTGSGNVQSHAKISMQHVIAVVRHEEVADEPLIADNRNVYALPRRR